MKCCKEDSRNSCVIIPPCFCTPPHSITQKHSACIERSFGNMLAKEANSVCFAPISRRRLPVRGKHVYREILSMLAQVRAHQAADHALGHGVQNCWLTSELSGVNFRSCPAHLQPAILVKLLRAPILQIYTYKGRIIQPQQFCPRSESAWCQSKRWPTVLP